MPAVPGELFNVPRLDVHIVRFRVRAVASSNVRVHMPARPVPVV